MFDEENKTIGETQMLTDITKELNSAKKRGRGSIIAIVLLFILVLGLIGYICYDKGVFDKYLGKEEKEKEKTEEKLSEEEVMKLHDKLIVSDTEATLYFDESVNIDSNYDKITEYLLVKYADENNWEEELDKYYKENEERDPDESNFNKVKSVSKEQIESILKEEFNVAKTLTIKDNQVYNYRAWNITYSSKDEMFYLGAGTAGAEYGGIKAKMTNYEQNNGNLYVYDKVIMCHYGQSPESSKCAKLNNSDSIVTISEDSKILKNNGGHVFFDYDYVFNKYDNKINTYKTTFKKGTDGKYYWYSSEIVNE